MWWQRLAFVLGISLMAVPSLFGLPSAQADALHILGPLAAATGFIAASEVTRGVRWLNLPLGLALLVTVALVGYPMPAAALVTLIALALVVLAFLGGRTSTAFGGGWRSLFS